MHHVKSGDVNAWVAKKLGLSSPQAQTAQTLGMTQVQVFRRKKVIL